MKSKSYRLIQKVNILTLHHPFVLKSILQHLTLHPFLQLQFRGHCLLNGSEDIFQNIEIMFLKVKTQLHFWFNRQKNMNKYLHSCFALGNELLKALLVRKLDFLKNAINLQQIAFHQFIASQGNWFCKCRYRLRNIKRQLEY